MKTSIKLGCLTAIILGSLILGTALPAYAGDPVTPIPTQPDARPVPFFIGHEAVAKPITARLIPDNPYMADGSWSSYHNDAYQSDLYFIPGPLGHNPIVTSAYLGAAVYPIFFFTDGRILSSSLQPATDEMAWHWQLNLMDPDTLEILDTLPLPADTGTGSPTFPVGAYFYVDQQDRIVVGTSDQFIWIVSHTGNAFDDVNNKYDLTNYLDDGDDIRYTFPDFSGFVWFVTREGVIGTLNMLAAAGNQVHTIRLAVGELFENGLAADEDGGLYFNSSKALYRFDADVNGVPVETWREEYDYGTHMKVVSRGSGSTPTMMGADYVTMTDNADPQMHVLVYRRAKQLAEGQQRLVCSVPVFLPGQGANENSLIATDKSIIAYNNFGYRGLKSVENGKTTKPGFTRIDLDEDGNGCHTIWTSMEEVASSGATQKMSVANGLIYAYTKSKGPANTDAWYFTAIDFYTGETVYKVLAGTGSLYNDHLSVVYLGPNGRLYTGVLGGIVSMRDGN